MNGRAKKTGRPTKISIEDKKQIIINYFLYEVQGSAERMSVHNIYALLSSYANKNGYNTRPYDFSRDEEVKKLIQSMELPHNQDSSIIPAYIPLDIKDLVRKTSEEIIRVLNDREDYCKNMYTRAARALEEFKSLICQIESLKGIQEELTQKVQDLCNSNEEIKVRNIRFAKENKYLKAYIKSTVEPLLAESIITGNIAPELSDDAQQLPKKGQEPAVVSITDYINNNCENKTEIVSAKSILKIINGKER
jgi:FtsZ-binding cell division protein ZapB